MKLILLSIRFVLTMTLVSSAIAQAEKPAGTKQEGVPRSKAVAESDEATRQVIREGIEVVNEARERAKDPALDGLRTFHFSLLGDEIADALRALANAQALVGEQIPARATCRDAIGIARELSDQGEMIDILLAVARVQAESGDLKEARSTLDLAATAVMPPDSKPREGVDFMSSINPASDSNTPGQRATALRLIASAQAAAGDREAARVTFGRAIEEARTISEKDFIGKVTAWAKIASAQESAAGPAPWSQASRYAATLGDEHRRARAFDVIIRARLRAGQWTDVLRMAEGELKGDSRAFALWVIADEFGSGVHEPQPAAVNQLLDLTRRSEFDQDSKRQKILIYTSRAVARLGNYTEANQVLALIPRGDLAQQIRLAKARLGVTIEAAKAQLRAGRKAAARDLIRATMQHTIPGQDLGRDDDGDGIYSWVEIAELLAQSGDPSGALQMVDSIGRPSSKVMALARISVQQAESGDRASALRTLALAVRWTKSIDNEVVWSHLSPLRLKEWPDDVRSYRFRDIEKTLDDRFSRSAALRALVLAQAKAGDISAAYETLEAFPEERLDFERLSALEEIGEVQLMAGDFEGALKTASRMRDREHWIALEKKKLFQEIARGQARAGDSRGALTWIRKQEQPEVRLPALKGMAEGICLRRRATWRPNP